MILQTWFWRVLLLTIGLTLLVPVVFGIDSGLTPDSPWSGQVRAVPLWLRIWLMGVLFPTFVASLLFVHRSWEARAAAVGFIVSHVPMMFHFFDVTVGVVGLMHLVCWSPALYLLVKRRPSVDPKTLFGVWVHSMIAVLSLSLAFDLRDAMLYFIF